MLEVLVVVSVLAGLAGALVPHVAGLLEQARKQDVTGRFAGSWRLARAWALARQRPVRWQIVAQESGVVLQITEGSGPEAAAWRQRLPEWHVTGVTGAAQEAAERWGVVVGPEGLTESVVVDLTGPGQSCQVVLAGALEP